LFPLSCFRHQWDSYIVADNTPGSSRVPRGWVIPPVPSSTLWSNYINQESEATKSKANRHQSYADDVTVDSSLSHLKQETVQKQEQTAEKLVDTT